MGVLYCFGDEAARRVGIKVNLKSRLPQFLGTLRDGPLEKLWGGGRGIFEPPEFFFVIKFLV